jgi:hypothetical protein
MRPSSCRLSNSPITRAGNAMKIEPTGCFWVLAAAIVIGAISSLFPSDESRRDAEVKSLIAQEEKLNDKCRDTWKDATEGKKACDSRDTVVSKLTALGWCYGHNGQIEADRKWETCQSEATPIPKSASSDAVQFDPDAAVHKAQWDQLESGTNDCMYRAMSGLLIEGVRSRSQLLGFAKNTCGSGFKKFLMSVGTPEGAADGLLDSMANRNLEAALREG